MKLDRVLTVFLHLIPEGRYDLRPMGIESCNPFALLVLSGIEPEEDPGAVSELLVTNVLLSTKVVFDLAEERSLDRMRVLLCGWKNYALLVEENLIPSGL